MTIEKEIWKKHPVYTRYEISNMGRVRSLYSRGKLRAEPLIMTLFKMYNGYMRVMLYDKELIGKNGRLFAVHRLVLETFCPIDNWMVCNHKNHVRDDNRLSNLEWVTYKQNNEPHIYEITRQKLSKRVGQFDLEGNLIKEYFCIMDAHRESDGFYDRSKISAVCNGKRKTHRGYAWKFLGKKEV